MLYDSDRGGRPHVEGERAEYGLTNICIFLLAAPIVFWVQPSARIARGWQSARLRDAEVFAEIPQR